MLQWKFISTSVANEYQIMNNAAPSSYLTYVQAANMAGHAQAVGTPGVPTTFLISTITLGQSPVTCVSSISSAPVVLNCPLYSITDVATGLVLTAWVNPDPAHRSDTSTPVGHLYALSRFTVSLTGDKQVTFEYAAPGSIQQAWTLQSCG